MTDILAFLSSRQSASALSGPAPSTEQIDQLIRAATAVPDHGRLRPYRFVLIDTDRKEAFGEALMQVVDTARGGITDELKEKFRKRAQLAPVQIAVIYSPKASDKAPPWEQRVTASCTGYAIILAATAMGLGANWRSSSVMRGGPLNELLRLTPEEEFLGWVNLGQPAAYPTTPRAPVEISELLDR